MYNPAILGWGVSCGVMVLANPVGATYCQLELV